MSSSVEIKSLLAFIQKASCELMGIGYYNSEMKEVIMTSGNTDDLPDYFHSLIQKIPDSSNELYFDLTENRFVLIYPSLVSQPILIFGKRASLPLVKSRIQKWELTERGNSKSPNAKPTTTAPAYSEKSQQLATKGALEEIKAEGNVAIRNTNVPNRVINVAPELTREGNSDMIAISRIQKRIKRKHSLSPIFPEHAIFENLNLSAGGILIWRKRVENKITMVTADCHQHGMSGALLSVNFYNILDEYDFSKFDPVAFYERVNTKIHYSNLDYIGEGDLPPDVSTTVYQIDLESKTLKVATSGEGFLLVRDGEIALDSSNVLNPEGKVMICNTELSPDDVLVFYTSSLLGKRKEISQLISDAPNTVELIKKIENGSTLEFIRDSKSDEYLLGVLQLNRELF